MRKGNDMSFIIWRKIARVKSMVRNDTAVPFDFIAELMDLGIDIDSLGVV